MKAIRILTLTAFMISGLGSAYAMDSLDAQLHSMVTEKVQQDHAADVKAGRVGHPASHGNSGSTTAAAASSSSAMANHPSQVQDLKRRHHKKTPPPVTHPGHHY